MPLFFGPVLSVNQSDGGFGNGLINPIRFSKNERLNITKDGTTKRAMNKRLTSFMVAALHGKAVFVFCRVLSAFMWAGNAPNFFNRFLRYPSLPPVWGQSLVKQWLVLYFEYNAKLGPGKYGILRRPRSGAFGF